MNKNYDFKLDEQFIVDILPNLESLMKIPSNGEMLSKKFIFSPLFFKK